MRTAPRAGHRGVSPMSSSVDSPATTLMEAPPLTEDRTDRCHDLLATRDPSRTNLLRIVYNTRPSEVLRSYRRRVGARPARTVVLTLNRPLAPETRRTSSDGDLLVLGASPTDLTACGIECRRALETLDDDRDLVVCFDSITSLLQFADRDRALEFLHTLAGTFRRADATAHFHVDPSVYDETTLGQLRSLFDEQVCVEPAD